MGADWNHIKKELNGIGLNVVGVADGRPYESLLPGCRSVVVFASGGRDLWNAFYADLKAHPEHLVAEDHPFDAFVARGVAAVDPKPDSTRRWVFCAARSDVFVDFRLLAHRAGLGWTSVMGLLLHPRYGLWIGLRAACFTSDVLPRGDALSGEGPCASCSKPCMASCPGEAFPDGALDIHRCARFHLESESCHGRCHARLACPVGHEYRHSALQHHYHNARATGRIELARRLGIEDDRREGEGPYWEEWSEVS